MSCTVWGAMQPCPRRARRRSTAVPGRYLLKLQREDVAFRGLVGHTESMLGRVLRRRELETLYSVYTELNLPADVLMLLVNRLQLWGNLSAREIERQAYSLGGFRADYL